MIDKPLYQNPLGGGLGQIIPNPGAGIADRFPGNPNRKPPDPIMQGFHDSEFRKNANMYQQDAVNFKYKGQDMMMNGSMSGAFKQYLDSIGKGDLYEGNLNFTPLPQPTEGVSQDVLGNPNLLAPPILDGTRSVSPIVTGPEEIASAETNPFNRVGQQLTGPNQNNNILETLQNIEKGIASLSLNYGQGNNMNQSSNYGNFDNFGIGNFYPPYGGMYG